MISKAKATKGSEKAIDYIMNDKGKAEELDRNLIAGENGREILKELRTVQSLNTRCQNNTYTVVLSPDANQKKFSQEELREMTRQHLKNLGLDKNQYIAYVHNSTKQQHVHIIANRIDLNGKAHSDNMIHKKAHQSANKIAKEKGLYTAQEVQKIKTEKSAGERKKIKQAYTQSRDKAKSKDEFVNLMKNKGYNIKFTINKQGKLQGFRIENEETKNSFKASEIGKDVRILDLSNAIAKNKEEKIIEEKTEQKIERNYKGFSR